MRFKHYSETDSVPTKRFIPHPTLPGEFIPLHISSRRMFGIDYASPDMICFVTFRVIPDCDVRFAGPSGQIAWNTILNVAHFIGIRLYTACLMPDHAHLLVSPSGSGESVSDIVGRTKTMCFTELRRELNLYLLWQESFHDHVLREQEKTEHEFNAIAHYIYSNPERAGLGDDYPFRKKYVPGEYT